MPAKINNAPHATKKRGFRAKKICFEPIVHVISSKPLHHAVNIAGILPAVELNTSKHDLIQSFPSIGSQSISEPIHVNAKIQHF
jgi:hypothetical protein